MRQDDSTVRKAMAREKVARIVRRHHPVFDGDPSDNRSAERIAAEILATLESSPADGDTGAGLGPFPRLQTLVDSDRDHMIARTADDMEWLIEQLLMYPDRVHPKRTTNHRFLRYSMAATLLAALTPTETGEQLFPARGKSPPADADAVKRLIAAVDAWIEDPDTNAEQEIMDARAALRGLGGAEG